MSTVAYVLLLFMLIDTSSMLEIYMIGVAFVMVYILELIMKLSNLLTDAGGLFGVIFGLLDRTKI